jgi:hypothetical protein
MTAPRIGRKAEALDEVGSAVCIEPTVVGKARLIVRELDSGFTN